MSPSSGSSALTSFNNAASSIVSPTLKVLSPAVMTGASFDHVALYSLRSLNKSLKSVTVSISTPETRSQPKNALPVLAGTAVLFIKAFTAWISCTPGASAGVWAILVK